MNLMYEIERYIRNNTHVYFCTDSYFIHTFFEFYKIQIKFILYLFYKFNLYL